MGKALCQLCSKEAIYLRKGHEYPRVLCEEHSAGLSKDYLYKKELK